MMMGRTDRRRGVCQDGDKCAPLPPILARHFSDFLDARCFDLKTELG